MPARRALIALAAALVASAALPARGANPHAPYPVRGIYDRDLSARGFDDEAATGFNLIDSGPYAGDLDPLAARGLLGMVWLGNYSNATCTFEKDDDWVRSHVAAIAGNPGAGTYYVADEPDATACPAAPAEIKARSDLVRSLDPGSSTLMVAYRQLGQFAGATDIMGLDHYPCSHAHGCDYSIIDEQAAEADRLGLRYWGVIQAHGDSWYRVPTPDELHEQFVHWRATNMEGYLVFAWRWPASDPSLWLANNTGLRLQLSVENAGGGG